MLFLLWGLFRLSGYNMSWKRKGIRALWRNSSSFSSASLQCDTPLFTFFFIYLFFPPLLLLQSFRQLVSGFGLAGGCRFSSQCVTGFFWFWSRSQLVSQWLLFALDTVRLLSVLMHLLKAWFFIHFLYTTFRYTPGLGNDQSCFFMLPCSFLCQHGKPVGTGLTSGNPCFQPIYLHELPFWIIFSAFPIKTLKMSWPSFFTFLTHKNIAKTSPFTDLTSSYLSVSSTCRHRGRSERQENWVE